MGSSSQPRVPNLERLQSVSEPTFGQRLRLLRLAAKLTLRHLAENAGLQVSTIGEIERDLRQPYPSTILALAHGLGVGVEALAPGVRITPRQEVPFGRRLRDTRLCAELTQANLAARCGMLSTSISAMERGRHRPSRKIAQAIADALGVPLETLTADSPPLRSRGRPRKTASNPSPR